MSATKVEELAGSPRPRNPQKAKKTAFFSLFAGSSARPGAAAPRGCASGPSSPSRTTRPARARAGRRSGHPARGAPPQRARAPRGRAAPTRGGCGSGGPPRGGPPAEAPARWPPGEGPRLSLPAPPAASLTVPQRGSPLPSTGRRRENPRAQNWAFFRNPGSLRSLVFQLLPPPPRPPAPPHPASPRLGRPTREGSPQAGGEPGRGPGGQKVHDEKDTMKRTQ